MAERRALVVEVDAATQLGLLGFLRVRGYQCVAASSADEAVEALAEGSFSFTLVDLNGNGTNPAEVIQCLRVRGRNSGPIIAVSDRRDHSVDL
ncbi:MAG TPA: response regulator, partial [Gemmatimonadaceae bacterium]